MAKRRETVDMTLREKIALREAEHKSGDLVTKALWRAFIWIMLGYAGGTIIGEVLRRLIYG